MGRFAKECQTNVCASRNNVKHWRFAQNGGKNDPLKEERASCLQWVIFHTILREAPMFDIIARSPNICLTFLREAPHWSGVLARSTTTYATFLREAPTFFEALVGPDKTMFVFLHVPEKLFYFFRVWPALALRILLRLLFLRKSKQDQTIFLFVF